MIDLSKQNLTNGPPDILFLFYALTGLLRHNGRQTLCVIDKPVGHLIDRQHEIDHTGCNSAVRHSALHQLAGIRALREGETAAFLDGFHAERSVRPSAG